MNQSLKKASDLEKIYTSKVNEKLNENCPEEATIPIFLKDKEINDEDITLNHRVKNLVFSGGGVKGFAHIGALKALEEFDLIDGISTFVGTSVGAIISSLYLVGYKSNDMIDFLSHFKLPNIKKINFANMINLFGLDKGEKIEYLLNKLLSAKKIDPNITMLNFYKLTGVELILTTVCINDMTVKYISYKTDPEMKLITAIRMSFSVPFYFTPVEFNKKMYIDGGCIDNYPIHLFDHKENDTIGLFLFSSCDQKEKLNNLEEYGIRVIQCLIEGFNQMSYRDYSKSTILIDLETTGMLDFEMNFQKIKLIFQKGYDQTKKYLEENLN